MDTKPHKILNRNKLGEIEEKEIETGISDGKRTEIIKGLSDGEIVIREVKGKSKSSDSTNPFSPMRKKKEKTEKKQ
jgi:hypothetical protein